MLAPRMLSIEEWELQAVPAQDSLMEQVQDIAHGIPANQ
jgi:hypothetical protein